MKNALINIQVLYEIAMSIGTSLDLKTMLQKSLSTYLRKLSCAAGVVLLGKLDDNAIHLGPVFSIPRTIGNNPLFQTAMGKIPKSVPIDELDEHLKRLPNVGSQGERYFHMMELPNVGLLLLFKHGSPLDPYLIKSLAPLNARLAEACQSCLRKERIQTIANELKIENRERQKAEMALAVSHEQLETIFDSLAAMVYVADLDTHEIIFTNRYMNEHFGENLIGRVCYEVIRGKDRRCQKCKNDQLLDSRGEPAETVTWEEYNPKVSNWFMHHARAIPWKDGGLARLQISTDIGRIKQLEQERMEAAQRQQVQRLDSLGTLAGGIAHEFNNLLMGMMGCVSLMKIDMKAATHVEHNLQRIERNVREAAALTDKLLSYAQKGRYEGRSIQVNTVLQKLIDRLSKSNTAIKTELDLSEDLLRIQADPHQIELAFLNVLTNAYDAMPDGGHLHIHSSNMASDHLRRWEEREKEGAYVRIVIQDSGSGMAAETKDRIFEPFYTTKTVGRGAGLGMAATYGIVKGHKGFIEVTSTQGRGSKIVVYLLALSETETLLTDTSMQKETAETSAKTILLVDDEPIVLEIGDQMLSHLGHKVITAESGHEAIALFRQQHKAIDLIILDIVMPKMTGEQAYKQLKAIDPNVKIFISSGFNVQGQDRTILVKGADDFLQKPFSMQDLKNKIG